MKKVFSLILAVAMVLSLASVAFATLTEWDEKDNDSSKNAVPVKLYNNDKFYVYSDSHEFSVPTTDPTFGKVIYYPLFVSNNVVATQDKSVASLNLSYVIEEGSAYVKSVSIVKKYGQSTGTNGQFNGYDAENGTKSGKFNGYYIAVATQGSATGEKNVSGIISLTGKTGSGSDKLKDEAVHFAFKLAWTPVDTNTDSKYAFGTGNQIALDKASVVTGEGKDVEFTFNKNTTFTVEMVNGEKVVIKYNEDAIKELENANEEAGISFMNFNDTTFKRSGDLLISADEDEPGYLYEINPDNTLKNISATYNEEEGGFYFKAKKLTRYCLSDLPLVDAEGTVAAAPGAVNPVTGAIA